MDECRKAFEDRFRKLLNMAKHPATGDYVAPDTYWAWEAWNARTEAKVSGEVVALDVIRKAYSDASNWYLFEHQYDGMSKTAMHDARFDAGMLAVYALQLPAPQSPVGLGDWEDHFCRFDWSEEDTQLVSEYANKDTGHVAVGFRAAYNLLANARESREGFDTEVAAKAIFARDRSQRGSWDELHPADQNYYYETAQKVCLEALATVGKEG